MANFYSDELISEVIAANDIVDIASGYMKLQRSGNGYKGLCPFHSEKTPSFHISADKQLYHCFGCGVGGSSLQFIMNIENLDFVEALKFLADRAKISLPEENSDENNNEFYEKRQAIYKVNAAAAKYFNKTLFSDQGKIAQRYVSSRQLDSKTAVSFGLGYANPDIADCTEYLKAEGFSEEIILAAGLAKRSTKTNGLYDFFRDRLMFPIIDVRGNVIAFGGRILGDGVPKYLNSADIIVFNKSKTLYALNFAKHSCHDRIILCEGYMDVIALHKSGFTNAVATLGTALTEQHAKIISRYTKEVVLCYDSDGAGQKATAAAIELLKAAGVKTKVLTLPGAKDPDEYIKKMGASAFESLIFASENATLYKISKLKQQYNIDNIEEKIELTNKMAEIFAGIENTIERECLMKEVAVQLDISFESIDAQVKLLMKNNAAKQAEKEFHDQSKKDKQRFTSENTEFMSECKLISLMFAHSAVYNDLNDKISDNFFKVKGCSELLKQLRSAKQKRVNIDIATAMSSVPPEYSDKLSYAILKEQPYTNPIKAATEIYNSILKNRTSPEKDINSPEELSKIIDMIKKQKNK